jgi:hypothetical protein
MKVRLDTDYEDSYDSHFDVDGSIVFNRNGSSRLNRIEMYKILNMIGLKTPKFGMVAELYKDLSTKFHGGKNALKSSGYDNVVELVVFTDIMSSSGSAMVKMSLDQAREEYPGLFAVQYIPTRSKTYASVTERLVMIGDTCEWLRVTSVDDWRSNCGDTLVEATLSTQNRNARPPFLRSITMPLYAIDFVTVGNEILAIDLDITPIIKGTPIDGSYTSYQIAKMIKDKIGDMYGFTRF